MGNDENEGAEKNTTLAMGIVEDADRVELQLAAPYAPPLATDAETSLFNRFFSFPGPLDYCQSGLQSISWIQCSVNCPNCE